MKMHSEEEAAAMLFAAAENHAKYPQNAETQMVTVTLTDEQWNVVAFAISAALIAQITEGHQMLPEFMTDQLLNSGRAIYEATSAVLKDAIEEEPS
jgi:hypothetical protein